MGPIVNKQHHQLRFLIGQWHTVADTKIAATPSAKPGGQFVFIVWISNSSGLFFSVGVTMSILIHALNLMKSMTIWIVKQAWDNAVCSGVYVVYTLGCCFYVAELCSH